MADKSTVAVLVGSLRKGSFSRMTARALGECAPASIATEILEIGDLGPYNQDLDANPPAVWSRFRDRIKASHAVMFVTPEYNRSVPGVLKNAIDVASRPYGSSAWNGKPAAIVSCSPGAIGAFGANHHLRQSLVFLNAPTMQQPEAYVNGIASAFDEHGKLIDQSKRDFFTAFMKAFADWIDLHRAKA